jgi:parvulin-like peptidyl-prolyl isomerase
VLATKTGEEIHKQVKLDEADVRNYYDEHKAEFQQIHARHLLVRMQGSTVPVKPGQKDLTEEEALAKCQELRKKIEAGGDFATVAIAESDDTASGARGGDLGFIRKGQMVPTFEQAAFALKAGELSQPVKTQFGYHLIKIDETGAKPFEEVRADLERRMRPEAAQKYVKELEARSGIVLDPEYFGLAPAAK